MSADAVVVLEAAGFIALHLLTFLLFVRSNPSWNTERGVFCFHLVAFAIQLLVLVVAAGLAQGAIGLWTVAGCIAMQAIYSLTFLEVWALSDGGYSLAILRHLSRGGMVAESDPGAPFRDLADAKLRNRLDSLCGLRLARRDADGWCRTLAGQSVSAACVAVEFLANLRRRG